MPIKILWCIVLLAAFSGCRDGPASFTGPGGEHPPLVASAVQAAELVTLREMLDDPLVLELIRVLDDQAVAHGISEFKSELFVRDIPSLQRTLAATLGVLESDFDGTDDQVRDVLKLVLMDAGMLIGASTVIIAPEEAFSEPLSRLERENR